MTSGALKGTEGMTVGNLARVLWAGTKTCKDRILGLPDDFRAKRLARTCKIGEHHRRIYHYHIQKTGGTSLNNIFLSLVDSSDFILTTRSEGKDLYHRLSRARNLRIIEKNKVFVGWNKRLIEAGNYFYAFSHLPKHELKLPNDTFTITCIRDPVQRVQSHYKELLFYKVNKISHPIMRIGEKWLGKDFNDYLSNVPKERLLAHLYTFSKHFHIEESLEHIFQCSHVILTERFSDEIEEISVKLGIKLSPVHIRKSRFDYNFSADELSRLTAMLESEILLYEKIKKEKL